ncbi:MAG TPA: GTPase Era [Bryobacteraceae bacterium]|nr:GTPase Era [Bryobacteraceae bacterium]
MTRTKKSAPSQPDPGLETPPGHVSGFVSLIGRPNAGKSTLLNAMVGTKLAIVADKPQTTRTIIQGVVTTPESQIVFLDTPGIHQPKNLLHKHMAEKVREALGGRDLILFLVDANHSYFSDQDEQALHSLKDTNTAVILVLNKIDSLKSKTALLPLMEQYAARYDWAEIIPISALTKENLDTLTKAIVSRLPPGPRYFPEDYLTNQPERFLVAELIREKILHHTREEVPHSVAVVIDTWADEPRKDGSILTRILATIHVERAGQKAILIGEKGAMLKQVGAEARVEIEQLLDRKVYLELFIRITADWRQRAQFLHELYQ